jgi:preprotein translocase subunit SecD
MRALEGVDMSRQFEGHPMTIHLVHDQSDTVLAATSQHVSTPEGWRVVGKGDARLLVQIEPLLVDGIESAEMTSDLNNKSAVQIEFRPDRREHVVRAMREYRGRRFAIVVGDQLYGAPRMEGEPRDDGAIQIGGLEPLEANDLALGIRMGMFPTAFRVVEGHYLP